MSTNLYFRNYDASNEQTLYEDLIIEAIRMYGEDMYYCPRVLKNYDPLYTADDSSEYNSAYLVELYIKSVDGFSGDGNFMSKFGIEIRDQVVFSVARRVFNEEVGMESTLVRPNEGDLIYFPLNKKLFKIMFVNKVEPLALHRFTWLKDEEIGALDIKWNYLAIEYPPIEDAKLIHYTLGTPCFAEFKDSELSKKWWETNARSNQGIES